MLAHAVSGSSPREAFGGFAAMAGLLLVLVVWNAGVAAEGDTGLARRMLLAGKYAEAAEMYAAFAPENTEAALGCGRSHWAVGKRDAAVRVLLAAKGEHADVEAELARMAFDRGDYKAARTHCERAVSLDPDQLAARWISGELFRTAGQIDEALEAYAGLITHYGEHEVSSPDGLRWIGCGASRYAEWNRLHDQFQFLVNEFYPDVLKLEPGYWQAHYEAGLLFLAKYNRADADKQFKSALELNPNAAQVHVALARLAMIDHRFDEAQSSVGRALEINPGLQPAWLVKADLALANFDLSGAIEILEKHAGPLNPVSEAMLGRLAAGYLLRDRRSENARNARVDEIVDQVTGRNQHAGDFFFALGRWLDERHKAAEAERFYKEAVARLPQQVGPTSHLGLLYMHTGREGDARRALERTFAIDPFNLRSKNMLEVLDLTDSMQTHDTGHCVLKYDGRRDRILVRYAAPYVDEVYLELCERFGYRPPEKPLIEIFNRAKGVGGHQWFSARMTGLPYVGTIAASTGRIVAMVSPGEPSLKRRFNWARVLKHELVHVITLQQTDFNIPRWFTEGLAVWSEGEPRPQSWTELLVRRVGEGELFDLESIDFAFTRPDSSADWAMAYCQAELYVEFMLHDHRPEVLVELLGAYADNLSTPEALDRVFGLSAEEFQHGYVAYLEEVVAGLRGLEAVEEDRSVAELSVAHRKRPEDVDVTARLALAYLRRGADGEALEMASGALELDGRHQLASYVLGRLYVRIERPDRAARVLEDSLDRQRPEPRLLNLLAGLKLKAEEYGEAAKLYRLGANCYPDNLQWTRALARVYLLWGKEGELASVLERIAKADPDDLVTRKKLIEISVARGDCAGTMKWVNQALRVDVNDAEIHRAFAEVALGSHNQGLAAAELEVAMELDPERSSWRLILAETYVGLGMPEEARRVLWALLALDPASPGAQSMLETLESEERDAE
jgi:tetratricopeptide (TPR) repeat protein